MLDGKSFRFNAPLIIIVFVFVLLVAGNFTPKTDQLQISPAASPDNITRYEERGFSQLTQMKDFDCILPILTTSFIHFSWGKGFSNFGVKASF